MRIYKLFLPIILPIPVTPRKDIRPLRWRAIIEKSASLHERPDALRLTAAFKHLLHHHLLPVVINNLAHGTGIFSGGCALWLALAQLVMLMLGQAFFLLCCY
jgi:hypothetical protein